MMKNRMEYEKMYTVARWTLLMVALVSAVNLVWILIDKSFNFIATAAIPEVLTLVEIALYSLKAPLFWQIVCIAVTAAVLIFYFLCWQFAKAKPRWMLIGGIVYLVDYAFRLYLLGMDLLGGRDDLVMILLRVLIPTVALVTVIRGLIARAKLKTQ